MPVYEPNENRVILLVEDTPALAEVIVDLLTMENYSVIVAGHGTGALEIIRRTAVDLVVTDLVMPQMDGIALIRELRNDNSFNSIPVIVLTASDTANVEGADRLLRKPCRLDVLLQAVRQFID